jgi:hypothetical protein
MLQGKEHEIELLPNEWEAADARAKPKEPIFGPGVWDLVWYVVGFTVVATVVRYFVR